jgi:hypothetical protein
MKNLLAFLLAASLALNAGLIAKLLLHPSSASPVAAAPVPAAGEELSRGRSAALTAALASGDRAALAAAGFSAEDIRDFILGRAYARFAEQSRAFRSSSNNDGRYWKNNARNSMPSAAQNAAMVKAQRQLSEAVRVAFGDDAPESQAGGPSLNFLTAAKRTELRRIEQDYSDMNSEIYREQQGISLPSDEAKLKLLREEKERDIAAALSPEEREQYELHLSSTASSIRATYGDAIQTEDDYKKIFALRKTYDEQYRNGQRPGEVLTPEQARARAEAQKQLDLQIRAVIGEDTFAETIRANDPERKLLGTLQNRLNLPANVSDEVFASRDAYASQTQAINADSSLTVAQQRAQITALGNQALEELTAKLGKEAATAYAQRAVWIQMMKSGNAYSTNPKDSPQGAYNTYNAVFSVRSPQATQPNPMK